MLLEAAQVVMTEGVSFSKCGVLMYYKKEVGKRQEDATQQFP